MNKNLLFSFAFSLFAGTLFLQAQTKIGQDIDGKSQNSQTGSCLSLSADGKILAVGEYQSSLNGSGSGMVRIFQNNSGTWTQIGSDIVGKNPEQLGKSVSLSADGSIVAIGVPYYSGPIYEKQFAGGVLIMKNVSGTWTQIGYILGKNEYDNFGESVSLSADGNTVAVGTSSSSGNGIATDAGQVRVFQNVSGTWTQIGQDLNGEGFKEYFGRSVSLSADGKTIAVGAPLYDPEDFGAVKVYQIVDGVWTKIGLTIVGESTDYLSGNSVSISGDGTTVVVGCPRNSDYGNGNFNIGHARIYKNFSGDWYQIGSEIEGEAFADGSGANVSISYDGSIVAIGAPNNDGGGDSSGHTRIYQNIGNEWIKVGNDIDGEAVNDLSGSWVSLSADGKTVGIGAPYNDGTGILNSGHVRVYDISSTLKSNHFISNEIAVYPNPVKNDLYINLGQDIVLEKVDLYNNLGQFINSYTKNVINLSSLVSGIYFAEIYTDSGKITKKIIIE